MLSPLHGAHNDNDAEDAGPVILQKTIGQIRVGRQGPGQENRSAEGRQPGAQGVQIQLPALFPHAGEEGQAKAQDEASKAVAVAPLLVGDDQEEEHEPAHQERHVFQGAEGQLDKETAVKGGLALAVDPLEDLGWDIEEEGKAAAEEAVLPGPGENPFPGRKSDDPAAGTPVLDAGGNASDDDGQKAVFIPVRQLPPKGGQKPAEDAAVYRFHSRSLLSLG